MTNKPVPAVSREQTSSFADRIEAALTEWHEQQLDHCTDAAKLSAFGDRWREDATLVALRADRRAEDLRSLRELDAAHWARAERADTAQGYRAYLEAQPVGQHRAVATERLFALDEQHAWTVAEGEAAPDALRRFLTAWPHSAHADDAKRLLGDNKVVPARVPRIAAFGLGIALLGGVALFALPELWPPMAGRVGPLASIEPEAGVRGAPAKVEATPSDAVTEVARSAIVPQPVPVEAVGGAGDPAPRTFASRGARPGTAEPTVDQPAHAAPGDGAPAGPTAGVDRADSLGRARSLAGSFAGGGPVNDKVSDKPSDDGNAKVADPVAVPVVVAPPADTAVTVASRPAMPAPHAVMIVAMQSDGSSASETKPPPMTNDTTPQRTEPVAQPPAATTVVTSALVPSLTASPQLASAQAGPAKSRPLPRSGEITVAPTLLTSAWESTGTAVPPSLEVSAPPPWLVEPVLISGPTLVLRSAHDGEAATRTQRTGHVLSPGHVRSGLRSVYKQALSPLESSLWSFWASDAATAKKPPAPKPARAARPAKPVAAERSWTGGFFER